MMQQFNIRSIVTMTNVQLILPKVLLYILPLPLSIAIDHHHQSII
jgi:hypothetical protein